MATVRQKGSFTLTGVPSRAPAVRRWIKSPTRPSPGARKRPQELAPFADPLSNVPLGIQVSQGGLDFVLYGKLNGNRLWGLGPFVLKEGMLPLRPPYPKHRGAGASPSSTASGPHEIQLRALSAGRVSHQGGSRTEAWERLGAVRRRRIGRPPGLGAAAIHQPSVPRCGAFPAPACRSA